MAAQVGPRPVPARRRMNVDLSTKTELVRSFAGFNSTTVSEGHVRLARRCLEAIQPRSARYEHVPFHMILQWNQEKANSSSMIAQACDLLLKYVINLLKPKRPQVWRSIKITNSHFCARVDCMVGARDILVKIGYSETLESAMQFPEHVKEPDKELLQVIAAELLMAKLEAEGMQGGQVLTRQLSNPLSRQVSGSGTPTDVQSPHRAPPSHPSHITTSPTTTTTTTPPVSSGSGAGVFENGHYSPAIQPQFMTPTPTGRFSPHPSLAGPPYQQPTPRIAPGLPPSPNTQPTEGDTASLESSGDSNYGTPLSSNSPNTTTELSKSNTTTELSKSNAATELSKSNAAAELNDQLRRLRLERERIKGQMTRKVTTVASAVVTTTESERKPATSFHGRSSGSSLRELKSSSSEIERLKPHPIIEEEPLANGGGANLQTPPTLSKAPPTSSAAPPTSPRDPISGTHCPRCNHTLEIGRSVCDYCKSHISPLPPPPLPPPMLTETGLVRLESEEPRSKPLRASAASVEEAIQQHRSRTQVKQNIIPDPPTTTSSGKSSGGAAGVSGTKSFLQNYDDKLEAWKKAWRDRGYSDEEIPAEPASKPLPEPKKKEAKRQQKKRAKDFEPTKNTLDDLKRYQKEAERRGKMEEIAREGESLMECVKFCVRESYALEEIALAYRKCGKASKERVLAYLRQSWAECVGDLQEGVMGMVDERGRTVGCPSDLEARKYLVLSDGNVMAAARKVYHFRREKIEELQKRFRPHCELEWGPALLALSAFDMSVERAACSIQCETLQPLYEFIFSEWTEVPATDMKKIKQRLKNGGQEGAREANLRVLMGEFKLPTMAKAGMALDLMERVEVDDDTDYPLSYYVEAARDYPSLEEAERGLIKECPICSMELPVHETITMPGCTDTMCKSCFKGYFTVVIREKGVKHFNCPTCDQPDMTNRDGAQDLYQELFVHLIHEHVPDLYDMVTTKLAERDLQKDPGFRWCVNDKCGNCFINPNLERKKVQCPSCAQLMCFQCKKPWEDQHNGLSCEEFADWKTQNDPKFQKEGLAAHLQANGIECPDCHMRYELARGGCMHFKCTRCPNEFCSGCGGSFKKAQVCGRFRSCANKGLHAHHPRDCLYFMRDFSVEQLQGFLRENEVEFQTQPSAEQLEAARREGGVEAARGEGGEVVEAEGDAEPGGEGVELKCSVMLQKELVDQLVDEACGSDVKEGHAGLCEKHYKEYLVDKIKKPGLDPLPLYEKEGNIESVLRREEKPIPEREEEETDEHYSQRLIEHVMREVPLKRGEAAAPKPHPPAAAEPVLGPAPAQQPAPQ